jgi:hypothetical protein
LKSLGDVESDLPEVARRQVDLLQDGTTEFGTGEVGVVQHGAGRVGAVERAPGAPAGAQVRLREIRVGNCSSTCSRSIYATTALLLPMFPQADRL